VIDFNTAGPQRDFDVIPNGEIVVVQLNIKPGNVGEGGLLTRTKNGDAEMISAELIVIEGAHAKRKLWERMLVDGATDGQKQAADITRNKLRAIIECARGIKPTDVSEAAKKARMADYADFDGVRFMCKVGVEPEKNGYKAKNFVREIITPDRSDWHAIEQVAKQAATATTSTAGDVAAPITKPAWAR
jgi:hypothetical protein